MVISGTSPFGSPSRTRVLMALRVLGESYPRELARLTSGRLSAVQKALRSLELDGLVAGRAVGRLKLYRLNPRFFAIREVEALAIRLAESDRALMKNVSELRRRPRRSGKPLR